MTIWTQSRDGRTRTNLNIRFRLDLDDLARLLAAHVAGFGGHPDTMSAAEIRGAVREQLADGGIGSVVDIEADSEHRTAIARAFHLPRQPTIAPMQ